MRNRKPTGPPTIPWRLGTRCMPHTAAPQDLIAGHSFVGAHRMKQQCTKVEFLGYNMADPGTYPHIATQWCSDMLNACGVTDDTAIPKSRLFTHGAASLLVAHALSQGVCTLQGAAKWFSVGVRTCATVTLPTRL